MKEFNDLKKGDEIFVICMDNGSPGDEKKDYRVRSFKVKKIKIDKRQIYGDYISIDLETDKEIYNFYHKPYLPYIRISKSEYNLCEDNKYFYTYSCQNSDNLTFYSIIAFSCQKALTAWFSRRVDYENLRHERVISALWNLSNGKPIDPSETHINIKCNDTQLT